MTEKIKGKSFDNLIIIAILALFNFVYLETEYLFDNMIAMRLQHSGHLAKIVGVSYAIGLLLQFGNNNLINNDLIEAIVISAFILIWVILILGVNENTLETGETLDNDKRIKMKNPMVSAITLIVVVALMSCIFATLDNVVTLFHSMGGVDIGQLPRLVLALSGL